ncbi:MAG: motility protein A [Phycisphaerales bacterium]|nr:motility protein A [Phycisphaerales bacterium]
MDIGTLIGLGVALASVGLAVVLGGDPLALINIPSVVVVLGGSTGAVICAFPLARILKVHAVVLKSIFNDTSDVAEVIRDLVRFAEIARREGILSLENHVGDMKEEFVVRGIKMAVDGTDPELIRVIMETELEGLMDRHMAGKMILDQFAKYAPAFGMIGTLMGLIFMLGSMDDPASIGPSMAVALITTLYGAVIANVFAGPIADKLYMNDQEEVLLKTVIIAGVMSIQSGDNPRVVESKLLTYLPPAQRVGFGEDEAQAA